MNPRGRWKQATTMTTTVACYASEKKELWMLRSEDRQNDRWVHLRVCACPMRVDLEVKLACHTHTSMQTGNVHLIIVHRDSYDCVEAGHCVHLPSSQPGSPALCLGLGSLLHILSHNIQLTRQRSAGLRGSSINRVLGLQGLSDTSVLSRG